MLLFLHRCAGVLTLAAVLAGGSLPARAVAQGLTLADSERIAIDRDAMLREMRAQGAAMRERAVMDGELMDPQLRVGAVNVPVDSFSLDAEDMTMFEVGVVQEFKPGRSRQLSRKQMLQLATAMDATALDREWIVRREVRKLWTQLAFVGSAKALLADQAGWVEQMRQSARARYASGEGRQLDVLQAGLDAAMLREQQLDLDREEAMYRAQLSFWLGADEAARAQPEGLSPRAELEPLAALEARLARHPAQLDYMRRIDAARTAADVARELRKPAWMLDVSYGFRQDAPDGMSRPDLLSAMVTVGLPLFRGDRQDRAVSAAKLDEQGLSERHDDHQREMQAMLSEAWNTAHRTAELERFYETDLLPLAEQSVTAALLGWRSNRTMFDEVVMARRLTLETRMKHLRLAADRALAQHDIDYLAGDAR
ncbi:MAG: TolC family protein [Steroidobacteraceae bacterium]|nr:TolC family protein [Steroidobacteraceae bacterium]MBP7012833.1 TolC family protein [Steroidobacteraceae bacterium]